APRLRPRARRRVGRLPAPRLRVPGRLDGEPGDPRRDGSPARRRRAPGVLDAGAARRTDRRGAHAPGRLVAARVGSRRSRGGHVKQNTALTIASLLSILFTTFHLADDIARGMESGGIPNLIAVPILVLWLYGTLLLPGRRSGYAIVLLASLLGAIVPVVH